MLFPWVGLLEQIRLGDVFVHYDDVQFSKGSFVNRVQIKTPSGVRWLTLPLPGLKLGERIEQVTVAPLAVWRDKHLDMISRSLSGAPFVRDAVDLMERVYGEGHCLLGGLARASLLAVCEYFGLAEDTRFVDAKDLGVAGANSDRVLAVVKRLGGDEYITGRGARNYLDHEMFEQNSVTVKYMDYQCLPYPQLHGPFTPFVSSLDLIANCGKKGIGVIKSQAIDWRIVSK